MPEYRLEHLMIRDPLTVSMMERKSTSLGPSNLLSRCAVVDSVRTKMMPVIVWSLSSYVMVTSVSTGIRENVCVYGACTWSAFVCAVGL